MKIIHTDEEIIEKKIVLPMPEIDDQGEVKVPEILGRKKDSHVSEGKKNLIAFDSVMSNLSQSDIARIHGTSQSLVSYTSQGFNATNIDTRKKDPDVRQVLSETREKVATAASAKLLESLDLFNPTGLEQKELPGAALKLSTVLEKASQGFTGNEGPKVSFIVMAPRMRKEEDYGMIDVGED